MRIGLITDYYRIVFKTFNKRIAITKQIAHSVDKQ